MALYKKEPGNLARTRFPGFLVPENQTGDYSHSLTKSISGVYKWRIKVITRHFWPLNVPISLLSHWSQSACPHFDLAFCPHTTVKTERLEPCYYFGVMRTVSGVSQVAFEWAYFSLAKASCFGQKFRRAFR